MDDKSIEQVARVLKALAHPVRIKSVEFLRDGEKCVNEVMDAVGGKQSITSQQLNMMRDKGVLACRRDGLNVYYRIDNKNVIELLDCFHRHCDK